MKNINIFPALLAAIFLFTPNILFAQDPDVPIDGGVSLLIAAGVAYGVKKALHNKKKPEK